MRMPLAQSAISAANVFYLTLLLIFLIAVITAILSKRSRDKCLKFLNGYHVTLERMRGQTTWGTLRVFSSGVEIVFDRPYLDTRGRKKTSFLLYGNEMDPQLLSILRYHDELSDAAKRAREKQVKRTFNPGPMRRAWRSVRNLVNTLRDAFNAAIGA